MLIKPVNTLFDGKKSGFVHIISLTKSAVYGILFSVKLTKTEKSNSWRIENFFYHSHRGKDGALPTEKNISRIAPIPHRSEENDRTDSTEIQSRSAGAFTNRASSANRGCTYGTPQFAPLARGTPLDNTNNLSVICIYREKII